MAVSTDGPRIEGQGRAEEEDLLNQPSVQHQQALALPQQSSSQTTTMSTASFLTSLGLDHLVELFEKEQVSVIFIK